MPTRLPLAHISEPLAGGRHQPSAADPGRIRSGCDQGAKRDLGIKWQEGRRQKAEDAIEGVPLNMLAMLVRDLGFLRKCNPGLRSTQEYQVYFTLICARMRCAVGLALQCAVALILLPSQGVGFVLRQGLAIAGPPSRQWAKPDICKTEHGTRTSTPRSAMGMSSSLDSSTTADEYEVRRRGSNASAFLSECGNAMSTYIICIWFVDALGHVQAFNHASTPAQQQRSTELKW